MATAGRHGSRSWGSGRWGCRWRATSSRPASRWPGSTSAGAGRHARRTWRASPPSTPADAARDADALVAIPFDADQIREALWGDAGALTTLPPSSLLLLMSTVGPRNMRSLAEDLTARGYRVVDAPVTGGASGAAAGTLTVIAAGAPADLDAADPILQPIGRRIFRVGSEPGQGQMVKLVNQLLVGTAPGSGRRGDGARGGGRRRPQASVRSSDHRAGRSEILVSRVGALIDGSFETGSSPSGLHRQGHSARPRSRARVQRADDHGVGCAPDDAVRLRVRPRRRQRRPPDPAAGRPGRRRIGAGRRSCADARDVGFGPSWERSGAIARDVDLPFSLSRIPAQKLILRAMRKRFSSP